MLSAQAATVPSVVLHKMYIKYNFSLIQFIASILCPVLSLDSQLKFSLVSNIQIRMGSYVEHENVKTIIGIDLGTTYSCVAAYHDGQVQIIANDQGNRITPSWVAFTDSERLIGEAAKNQAATNAPCTIFDIKRLMGKQFNDPEVRRDIKFFPYKVVEKDSNPYIQMKMRDAEEKLFRPEEISAMILGKMKETAEAFLGKEIRDAVITVPAYFNDAQRQATKHAGTIAGLNVVRLINEPTAAAMAYGLDNKGVKKNILVYDLGGGTFDVSILTIDDGVFEVRATCGDTHLGGEDFDRNVMDYFIELIRKSHHRDISEDNKALGKLRRECERAKRILSSGYEVRVEIESLFDGVEFSERLTRAKFEELNMELFKKTLELVRWALRDACLKTSNIDEIVLVGGSTRIPKIRQLLKDLFDGKEPNKGINPDEAVAYGAAIQSGILSGVGGKHTEDIVLLDVTPLSLGVRAEVDHRMVKVIKRNTVIPTRKSKTFTTLEDNETSIRFEVYEGEGEFAKDCHQLGWFVLDGVQRAPMGVPQMLVTFNIDANGILQVTAQDKKTKKSASIVINNRRGCLSQEELERMMGEAKRFGEEDRIARQRIEAKNELETYLYDMKSKTSELEKLADKIDSHGKESIESAVDKAFEWFDENPNAKKDEYEEKMMEVEVIWTHFVEKAKGTSPSIEYRLQ
ncbi:Heat shock protein 70 family [Dillenia turbinata]|uniref:Heat shock protein 70 family n=1 Tax=Dillenia turbinata TaxID=194707 RepID=A0AAN8W9F1_9MAGN